MDIPQSNPTDYSASFTEFLSVPAECAGLRLDQALALLLPQHSRSRLQAWLREGRIVIEGVPGADAKHKVWGGEKIHVAAAPDPRANPHLAEEIALAVMAEIVAVRNAMPGFQKAA